jgi:hypothetical protein
MFYRILFKEGGMTQFAFAVFGSIVGMTLLLSSIQFYTDIKHSLNNNQDLIKPDYLIVNKSVSALNTINSNLSTFSKSQIDNIKNQKFVKSVSPFISNGFEVKAYTNPGHNVPPIYTDMFFESLPDEYLDIPKDLWKWSPGDSIVPIAVPRDYLSLYNFGYALSKGMPQISGSMVSMIKFTLTLNGKGKSKVTTGQIIGFTDRINTILAPYSFLEYTNKELNTVAPAPSRILVEAKDPSDKAIPKYLEQNGYETNKEKLKNSKLNILLNIMMSVLSGLSLTIILLSFMVFTLAFQLLITKKSEKIRTLLYLGYGAPHIMKYYVGLFIALNGLIAIVATAAVSKLKAVFETVMNEFNFPIESGLNSYVFLACALITVLIILINTGFLYAKINGLDKGKK